jgi:hypothetical protein
MTFYSWLPPVHSLYTDQWKTMATTFRVGTWFLSRLVDARECARSLSWMLWAWSLVYVGRGWLEMPSFSRFEEYTFSDKQVSFNTFAASYLSYF